MLINRNGMVHLWRCSNLYLAGVGLLSSLYSRVILSTLSLYGIRSINISTTNNRKSLLKNRLLFINKLTTVRLTNQCVNMYTTSVDLKVQTFDGAVALEESNIPQWAIDSMNVVHDNFDKLGSNYIKDLSIAVVKYRHKKTGLTVISLSNDAVADREMCFDIVVPTPPLNDCGSPHILEHSVLAGSDKYQSRDAFSIVVAGLSSYINASTYKDRTRYLFGSTNLKHFYNTADFYMDSVFRPLIRHDNDVFKQEAWHFKVSKEPSNDAILLHDRYISYAGIVYSEMRQCYSNALEQAHDLMYSNMFTNSYKFDSGGNPDFIVKLDYPQLVDFYERYYSTSTVTVSFYGPDDVKNRLNFIDGYLSNSKIDNSTHKASPDSAIKLLELEKYKGVPLDLKQTYGSLSNDLEDILLIGWLLDPHTSDNRFNIDIVDKIGLMVVEHLLMGTPESVLYKALIDSKIGSKVVGDGYVDYFRQSTFAIGIEGVKNGSELKDKFKSVVFETLNRVAADGFKNDAIKAAMNTVEFQLRELNTGSYPKGLALLGLIHIQMLYGKDPLGLLYFDSLLSELKSRSKYSGYFSNLIKRYFLDNADYAVIHMEAKESSLYDKEMMNRIKGQLTDAVGHYTRQEVDKLEDEYKIFKKTREEPVDPKTLEAFPTLEISDLNKENELIPTKFYEVGDGLDPKSTLKLLVHPIESQGIVYLDYAISLHELTLDELKYLKLFTAMLKEAGTTDKTSEEMSYIIAQNLGGLDFDLSFMTKYNDGRYAECNDGLGYLIIRTKALADKKNDMFTIINTLLKDCNFSNASKGIETIKRSIANLQRSIITRGHSFAMKRLARSFSVSDYAEELSNGYQQLDVLKEILPRAEQDWTSIEGKLIAIRNKLLKLNHLTLNITATPSIVEPWVEEEYKWMHKSIASAFETSHTLSLNIKETKEVKLPHEIPTWVKDVLSVGLPDQKDEAIVASTRINHVVMGGKLFTSKDVVKGEDSLALHCLDNTYLWKQVRMALGAYGVFARITRTGHVIFMSYADPNFTKTIDAYKNVPKSLEDMKKEFNKREFTRHKVSKIGSIDKPLRPDAKGLLSLERILRGEPEEFRSRQRREIMNAELDSLDNFTNRIKSTDEWKHVCGIVSQTMLEDIPENVEKITLN